MSKLENYYNKFNEEKRLLSRHGQVEYRTTMKYIHSYLKEGMSILDIGAGTGRYSVALANEGYDVTAVELVKSNLGVLKAKKSSVKAYQGTALDLSKFKDNSFDITLLFGPMYHLHKWEEKEKALEEAVRVTKKGGHIFIAYLMNEYGVIMYGLKEKHLKQSVENGYMDDSFKILEEGNDLYSFVRIEEIEALNDTQNVVSKKRIAADGPSDYIRPILNEMDEEEFELYNQYHLSTCERKDLLGASSHIVEVVQKQ